MESSLKNMVLTLGIITLISATSLGLVYNVTKAPIEASKSAKTITALADVLPPFDNNPAVDTVTLTLDGMPIKVYTGKKGDDPSGYAVETQTKSGFSGLIKMMVGFKTDGGIVNIQVLQHKETPGLGSKMTEPGNVLTASFTGKNPSELKMQVKKDGGDIDAITASTITSRAYTDAVARAYKAYRIVALGEAPENSAPVDPYARVLAGHDNDPSKSRTTVVLDNNEKIQIYTGIKDGEVLGYAIESYTDKGYGGVIKMLVGFRPDGEIIDIDVTENNETPGFGSEITNENNVVLASFKGRKPSELDMNVKTDEGTGDIDALTSATVTTRAYIDAVQRAYDAFKIIKQEEVKDE